MIEILKKGIFDALRLNSGVMVLLSTPPSGTLASIYAQQAPTGATKPYIVYIHAGGGDDHLTPQPSADVTFYILGVAKSPTVAGQIADAVRAAIHENETAFSLTGGWSMYRSQADAILLDTETIDSTLFHKAGNVYRFRITQ